MNMDLHFCVEGVVLYTWAIIKKDKTDTSCLAAFCLMYPWSHPCYICLDFYQTTTLFYWWKKNAGSLTFDAKFGVPSELENDQHQKETGKGNGCDTHHDVHLPDDKTSLLTASKDTGAGKGAGHG